MIFPKDSDAEEQLKLAIRGYLIAGNVAAVIDGDVTTPKKHVVIKAADETRPPIDAICNGKLAEWQAWNVMIDVVSDGIAGGRRGQQKGESPPVSSVVATLRSLFRHMEYPARNDAGIYTAQLQKDTDSRDGVEFLNPFVLSCETFTYLE